MNLLITALPQSSLISQLREEEDELADATSPHLLHLPLHRYQPISSSGAIDQALDHISEYRNIVFNNQLAANYFLRIISPSTLLKRVQNCVYFARSADAGSYLELKGIPAIQPQTGEKAIDIVQSMLQFKRLGATLYPCKKNSSDEIPGFLEELGIPVNELSVYKTQRLTSSDIASYESTIKEHPPDAILFHSNRSVNTLPTIFPMISMSEVKKIALNERIAQKMAQQNMPANLTLNPKMNLLKQINIA